MRRLIIGISGASGVIYGIRVLEVLYGNRDIETHLILSKPAERTIIEETNYHIQDIRGLASVVHDVKDIGASIASGSFETMGMAIVPCSIRTAGAIAHCVSDNLLTRAADVVLKERRKLILAVRETPLHLGHLRTLSAAAEAGAMILPPMPAFYSRPTTLQDLIDHSTGRLLDHLGIPHLLVKRWGEKGEM
jgi:flavin prenyltransferase